MFEKVLNVFRIDDLRKKIVTTLILLFVFRIGTQVPIPGISLQNVHNALKEFEKQGAEVVVVLAELGPTGARELARAVPEADIIIRSSSSAAPRA